MVPFAWAVIYEINGEQARFITLERSRADDYAAQHHGIIYPLDLRVPQAISESEKQNETRSV